MKKLILDAYAEAKKLPKGVWIVAAIMPFGIVAITGYVAGKSAYKSYSKKENQDEK